MAENNYLLDLEKQLQLETLELIAIIDEEIIKLSTDIPCSFYLKKVIRDLHIIQSSLSILGFKLYADHFEKLEMLMGFLVINNIAINGETLKITQKSIKLVRRTLALHYESHPNSIIAQGDEIARADITIANAEIGKLLSELKKNRKPSLKLDKDLHDDFIYDSRKQITLMTAKLELLSPNTADENRVTDLFRSLHTLKSSSSMYGYKPIEEVVHELENILTFSRDHAFSFNEKKYQLFQRSLKLLIKAVDELSDKGYPSSKIVDQLSLLLEDLQLHRFKKPR